MSFFHWLARRGRAVDGRARCRSCRSQAVLGPGDICPECRSKLGLPERWPRSRRLPRHCVRCDNAELVRAIIRQGGGGDRSHFEPVVPMGVTFPLRDHGVSMRQRSIGEPDLHEPAGILEAYVCRGCGFTEWYALEPEDIPIGPEYATELIEVGGGAHRR